MQNQILELIQHKSSKVKAFDREEEKLFLSELASIPVKQRGDYQSKHLGLTDKKIEVISTQDQIDRLAAEHKRNINDVADAALVKMDLLHMEEDPILFVNVASLTIKGAEALLRKFGLIEDRREQIAADEPQPAVQNRASNPPFVFSMNLQEAHRLLEANSTRT